jgi:hypothetical protein
MESLICTEQKQEQPDPFLGGQQKVVASKMIFEMI